MGQAKKRGSYEERKAAALIAREERDREEAILQAEAKARRQREEREVDRLYFEEYGRSRPKRTPRMAPILATMLAAEAVARMPK